MSKFLHSRGNHKQKEKTTNRLRKNIYKWCAWYEVNFWSIQTAHATQYQKQQTTKQANQKLTEDINRHFTKEVI